MTHLRALIVISSEFCMEGSPEHEGGLLRASMRTRELPVSVGMEGCDMRRNNYYIMCQGTRVSGLHTEKIDRGGQNQHFKKMGRRGDYPCALAYGHLGGSGGMTPQKIFVFRLSYRIWYILRNCGVSIMPRCACASEVYGSVFVCVCVCVCVCL